MWSDMIKNKNKGRPWTSPFFVGIKHLERIFSLPLKFSVEPIYKSLQYKILKVIPNYTENLNKNMKIM